MASLKEVRGRIASVTSTRKITGAMKLVSAAKLKRAQDRITSFLPFQEGLSKVVEDFVAGSTDVEIPYAEAREVKKVAVVAIAGNGSLCGTFNSNVFKKVTELLDTKHLEIGSENLMLFPIGKKSLEYFSKRDLVSESDLDYDPIAIIDKSEYTEASKLANKLMELFLNKEIDCVELVYNHFKNAAVQQITYEMFLPIVPSATDEHGLKTFDYILEPDKQTLMDQLVPTVIRLRLFSAILDSIASEHGARMTAMQTATDNAQELIDELKLKYNKARQEAITTEISDIVGGAEGLK